MTSTLTGGTGEGGAVATISFTVNYVDPCASTTLTTLTIPSITVAVGGTQSVTFSEVGTAIETSIGNSYSCGTRTYSIVDAANSDAVVSTGMTVTGSSGTYTVAVTPPTADDTWVTTPRNYKVKVVLASHTSITLKLDVNLTVNYATCSCANVVWNDPTAATQTVLVVLAAATGTEVTLPPLVAASTTNSASSTDPGIRTCYRTNSLYCATSNTRSFTTLTENASKGITFITFTAGATGNVITVKPTTSAQIGTYALVLTQTNTYGTASKTFTAMNLTVNCIVTGLSDLVLTDAQKKYNLYDAAKTLDFTDVGISPMTQTPACGYTFTSSAFTWTGLPIATNFVTASNKNA